MKTFCYHANDYFTGQKIFGGMVHAENMENAAKIVVKRNKLQVAIKDAGTDFEQYDLERDGKKIYLYVSVHPENIGLLEDSKSY